jgi:hypothetical protein
LPDNIGLTEFIEDIIKAIVAADHEKELIFGFRVVTYIGSITTRKNTMYMIGLITNQRNVRPKKDNKYILNSGNTLKIDRLLTLIYFLLNLKILKIY